MGGEPTFVSVDDMDGPEWNTTALGAVKRRLSGELIKRLRGHFAPGGLLFHGQGKWYPGESLPRWALACYWRRDGVPVWREDALMADESANYGHTRVDALRFLTTLARHLEIDSRYILPGYEDVWYYLWKERRLPTNVNPLHSRLEDEEERNRLARLFEKGLDKVGRLCPPHTTLRITETKG